MKRVVKASSIDQRIPAKFRWALQWYDVMSSKELAEATGDSEASIVSDEIENIEGYEGRHVVWLLAKEEYIDSLDEFICLEVIKEAGNFGNYKIVQWSSGRLNEVTDDVHAACLDASNFQGEFDDDRWYNTYNEF